MFFGKKEYPIPDEPQPSPYTKANILSKITYSWENPLFKVGYRRPLEKYNEKKFYEKWNKTETKKGKGKASVLTTLIQIFGIKWGLSGILKLISDGCSTISPVFLELLLDHLAKKDLDSKENYKGFVYIFCIFGLQLFSTIISNYYVNLVTEIGLSIRATVIGIIYRKTLKLSNKSRQSIGDGQIINLVSSDSARLQRLTNGLHSLWTSPIQLIAILVLLIRSLGVWSLIGFAIFVIVVPLQGVIMKFLVKFRRQTSVLVDQRVKKTQEVIGSMRVIKFFGWEESFLNILQALRRKEINRSIKGILLGSLTHAVFGSIPFISSAATFIAYSAAGNKLTAAKVFSSLAFFNMLRGPLAVLPSTFNQLADASVSMKRLLNLIYAKELDDLPEVDPNSEYAVSIKDGEFNWEAVKPDDKRKNKKKDKKNKDKDKGKEKSKGKDKNKESKDNSSIDSSDTLINNNNNNNNNNNTAVPKDTGDITDEIFKKKISEDKDGEKPLESFKLHDINIQIKKNSLTAIVGAVGSGKSSLISAIIGEMKREGGKIVHGGTISYCSQQAWIRNATVRDNILFGKEYDKELYDKVIEYCSLTHDLEIFPDGDMTEIGERGITLSGGQKQRINLARAVYFNSDIILMDDPLSAVDAHVSRALFDNCILGALANKTRILVTHHLHVLPRVDYIIVMKNGRIEEQGEYEELMKNDGEFSRLMRTYGGIDDSDDNLSDKTSDKNVNEQTNLQNEGKTTEEGEEKVKQEEVKKAREEKTTGRALMTKEERATGSVDIKVYKDYLKAAGGILFGIIILIFVVITQASKLGNDMWLVYWTDDKFKWETTSYIIVYLIWNVSQILLNLSYSIFMSFTGFRAAKKIHRRAISRVIRAPISFFDTTPLGRIINRFSKDQDSLDGMLVMAIQGLISSIAGTITTVAFMLYAVPIFGVALFPLLILYYFVQKFYISTSREIKRLEALARSPLFANFTETMQGLPTIRAYNEQERFIKENQNLIDGNNRPFFLQVIAQRWLGVRLECIGSFLVLFNGIAGLFLKDTLSAALLGLSLSYALQVTGSLNGVIRSLNELEINMNSAERLLYYANEIEMENDKGLDAPKDWPSKGKIEIKNLTMKYAPHLPPVLHNINLDIKSFENIGVVGRTGAGKSKPEEGSSIVIDDVSIKDLKLNDIRQRISIIPQDPILFSGTIRFNMDPFDEHTDQEIWEALENAGLKQTISELENKLDSEVRANGENFSVGQRQLLCLARAMIRNSHILVMDEATASVDIETDSIIQKALRTKFSNVTVLTIAHLLSKGEVLEYDTPKNLLFETNENGELVPTTKTEFSKLVDETGPVNAALLRQLALEKDNNMINSQQQ
ncbi:hypothetical protein BCR32DRAFT_330852 [Anaeromyces robustus]|uniref:P-loop containing nucleoside triphosphate hydrolase protein n=1 Tax=Anaeromyces robustus TaxID=1754192 RepID=A0A1Y1VQQ0_9FUNG|nr:hypothetical protein BCR32DRAFT_330852 [Anaeromyces robustus]|eukprot:ORX63493.1 hypothetical protein BCR32DRAFT_330852 [Anaeromyces robustus]